MEAGAHVTDDDTATIDTGMIDTSGKTLWQLIVERAAL